jgi:hypothetical protein
MVRAETATELHKMNPMKGESRCNFNVHSHIRKKLYPLPLASNSTHEKPSSKAKQNLFQENGLANVGTSEGASSSMAN